MSYFSLKKLKLFLTYGRKSPTFNSKGKEGKDNKVVQNPQEISKNDENKKPNNTNRRKNEEGAEHIELSIIEKFETSSIATTTDSQYKNNLKNKLKLIIYSNFGIVTICSTLLALMAVFYIIPHWIWKDEKSRNSDYCEKRRLNSFWPIISDSITTTKDNTIVWNTLIWAHAPAQILISRLLYDTYMRIYKRHSSSENDVSASSAQANSNRYRKLGNTIILAHYINNLEIVSFLLLSMTLYNHFLHIIFIVCFVLFSFIFNLIAIVIEYELKIRRMIDFGPLKVNLYWARYIFLGAFFIIAAVLAVFYGFYDCRVYSQSWVALAELLFIINYVLSHGFNYFVVKNQFIVEELNQLKSSIDLLFF